MSFPEILLLAVSLSLDAAVVAVGAGALARINVAKALKVSFTFGAFQGLMPLLGLLLGSAFSAYLLVYGHIVGFVLLILVGGKMLFEAFQKEDTASERNILHIQTLLILAVATSIDAFVVGITFSFLPVHVPTAVLTIGVVTFLLSLLGVYLGRSSKHLLGTRIEIMGAVVIILLAFKILLFS